MGTCSVTRILLLVAVISLVAMSSCDTANPAKVEPGTFVLSQAGNTLTVIEDGDTTFTLTSLKWLNGARAAVSITYDAPWGTHEDHHLATDAVIARDMRMDIEMVSWIFAKPELHHWIDFYLRELIPKGIGFFGHGHTHALHDTMDFDGALSSFQTNFDLMTEWGLKPKAYAYPGSSGEKLSTQLANAAAGFICARGSTNDPSEYYVLANGTREPENWYFLPSVVMGNASFRYIDTHEKLSPILDQTLESKAWVILMYHAIGIPEAWSFYPLRDFERDLDEIQAGGFWSANFEAAASYIQERNHLRIDLLEATATQEVRVFQLLISDGLRNDIYEQPLTFSLQVGSQSGLKFVEVSAELSGPLLTTREAGEIRFDITPDERVYTLSFVRL